MKTLHLFISLVLYLVSNIYCSEITAENSGVNSKATKDKQKNQKTLSILFKIMHKNESCDEFFIAKKPKDSYASHLNNFKQHTESLRDAIERTNKYPCDTETITSIRSKIITEDLIPLRHKIYNILDCIKKNNLYLNNSDQTPNTLECSPRIQIIDSMITTLKDNAVPLHYETVKNYQYIMNYIAHFSTQKNHGTMLDAQVLAALETISLNNQHNAQQLATLLHEETLNKKALKKCKKNLNANSEEYS
jgi:hypothetical protein